MKQQVILPVIVEDLIKNVSDLSKSHETKQYKARVLEAIRDEADKALKKYENQRMGKYENSHNK